MSGKQQANKFVVLAPSLAYPDPAGTGEKRAERGAIVSDLPAGSIPWLLEDGKIAPAEEQ